MGDHKPRPRVMNDGRPFAHFQWNYGWGVWEQVIPERANRRGVVTAYPAGAVDRAMTQVRDLLDERIKVCWDAALRGEAADQRAMAASERCAALELQFVRERLFGERLKAGEAA